MVAAVGKTTSIVFGLVLVLAVMVGVATAGFGADGDVFKEARNNLASFVRVRGDINGNTASFRGILEHSEGSSFLNTGFHTVVSHAPKGPPVDVLLSCPSQTSAGTLRIVNKTQDFGDSQRVWVDDGSANTSFDTLGQNQTIDKTVSPSGDHFTHWPESAHEAPPAALDSATAEDGRYVDGTHLDLVQSGRLEEVGQWFRLAQPETSYFMTITSNHYPHRQSQVYLR